MIGQRLAVWGSAALPATRERSHTQQPARSGPDAVERTRAAIPAAHVLASLRRSVLLQLMLAMALISLAALIYLNQASKESIVQFNIVDLQRQQIELNLRNANLYATATSLQNLGRIETLAATQLHMVQPSADNATWLYPTIPRVAPVPAGTPGQSAVQESAPLAWMQHAVQFIAGQL